MVSCCSTSLFLICKTCFSRCLFSCASCNAEITLSKKALALLLQKQVAHWNGLIGAEQVILIQPEMFGGKDNRTRDITKRVIIVARGCLIRLLKLGMDVLILQNRFK